MGRFLARVTVPLDGSSCPIRMRNRVVLPMPLGPTSASRAPLATVKVIPAKRSSAPKDLEREFTVMSDIVDYVGAQQDDFSSSGLAIIRCARTMDSVIAPRIIKQVSRVRLPKSWNCPLRFGLYLCNNAFSISLNCFRR